MNVQCALLCCLLLSGSVMSHAGHDHDHHHDSPEDVKFRYSREANTQHAHHEHDHSHGHGAHAHGHDHAQTHDHGHHGHSHGPKLPSKQLDSQTLWTYALGSTVLISMAPFFILFFIPLQNNNPEYQPLLRVLLGFASGGLLGDALLHLLPHAVEYQNHNTPHDHGHGHSHGHGEHGHVHDLTIWLNVLGGLFMFLVIEKFVRIANGGHSHDHGGHSHGSGGAKAKQSPPPSPKATRSKTKGEKSSDEEPKTKVPKKKKGNPPAEQSDIKITGYLNLIADFTHNFTDGLAIATSYMLGVNTGIISTATILFHEVPHEIGDFSILIQSGFSKPRAMAMQLVTAVGAISGTLVGLLAHGLGDAVINLYILPFTAGGFIYIATVSVLPELLEDTGLKRSLLQVLAIFSGVFSMVLISWYE